jgi:ribosomal subunit interface protein
MKLILKSKHQKPSPAFAANVEERMEELNRMLQIDEARVVFELDRAASPAFRVAAHLVRPGPDLYADAVDHTLAAAFKKALGQLLRRIRHRREKRARRQRNNSGQLLRTSLAGAHYQR